MTDLHSLINRVAFLDSVLTPESNKSGVDDDAELDAFTRLKKSCAREVAEIRKTIAERDELLESQGGAGTRQTIEMSAKVRSKIRDLKEKQSELDAMQRREAAKASKQTMGSSLLNRRSNPNVSEEEIAHKSEVVDLVSKHIDEIESLEKRRLHGNRPIKEDRAGLLGAGGGHSMRRTAVDTELENIDDETAQGLAMLQKKDEEIDQDLEQLSTGVKRLGNLALDMSEEIKMQNVMVEEITDKVENATAHLQNLNAKVKDTLDKAGGVMRILVNLILLLLFLAVAAYAARMVLSSK